MIPLPKKPKINKESDNQATFIIEELYPGYGITVGNALRRVLLSSLEGAAIKRVKIKDVPHEFSTIPGVKEDVIMILLNLKDVRFKMFEQGPFQAHLCVSGEKEVKASDFEVPSQLEVVNSEQHIATLTDKKACLDIEVEIGKGIGYESAEEREKEEEALEIGVIDIDAIYTPIEKVSFRVENMRVGKRTDFDRLILTLKTDGRIEPEQAFMQAVEILSNHFSLLASFEQKPEKSEKEEKSLSVKPTKDKKQAGVEEISIDKLGISPRTANILKENRIKTVAGLISRSEENILGMEGIGPKSIKEIKSVLKKKGLELK